MLTNSGNNGDIHNGFQLQWVPVAPPNGEHGAFDTALPPKKKKKTSLRLEVRGSRASDAGVISL